MDTLGCAVMGLGLRGRTYMWIAKDAGSVIKEGIREDLGWTGALDGGISDSRRWKVLTTAARS